jgi:ubiquinone/menaquinone biosynthesis C-methylase UbiE
VSNADEVQQKITGFWSTVAPNYEAHAGNVPPRDSEEYREWIKAFEELLPPAPDDVLDVATGTGFVAMIAASLGHRVTAIDLSVPMLELARTEAQRRGLAVEFVRDDAILPAFPAASFGTIVSRHLIWTLRDPERALGAWRSLIRSGGRLVAIDGFWFEPESERAATEQRADGLFEEFYTRETRSLLPGWRYFNVEPLVRLVERAGFSDVRVITLDAVQRAALHPPSKEPSYAIVGIAR